MMVKIFLLIFYYKQLMIPYMMRKMFIMTMKKKKKKQILLLKTQRMINQQRVNLICYLIQTKLKIKVRRQVFWKEKQSIIKNV